MRPGVHNLSEREYDEIDAVRSSTLNLLRGATPAHLRYALAHPRESRAFDEGAALHYAVLMPEKLGDYVAVFDLDGPFRTKAKRMERDAFMAANADKIVLRRGRREAETGELHYDDIRALASSLRAHPFVDALLASGLAERTLIWQDEGTGLLCKARPDWIAQSGSVLAVGEIKTTARSAGPRFGEEIARYGYHVQAAWYLRGLTALFGPLDRPFYFLVVEKTRPHCVAVHRLDVTAQLQAEDETSSLLAQYKRAKDDGTWPGWSDDVYVTALPRWAVWDG